MILHPDGRVEGTPQEIAQWKEMQKQKVEQVIKKKLASGDYMYPQTFITSAINEKGKCPNKDKPCYCTGECLASK